VPSTEDDAADADTPEQVQQMNRTTSREFLKLRVSIFLVRLPSKIVRKMEVHQNVRISRKNSVDSNSSREQIN
jgi:hypothetical protein